MTAIVYCVVALPRLDRRHPFNAQIYPVKDLHEVERLTHLRFPSGSILVKGKARHSWTAPALYAEIRFPRSQLEAFQRQAALKRTSLESSPLLDAVPPEFDLGWRLNRVRQAVALSGGDVMKDGQVEALVSLDDPTSASIFLCWNHD